MNLSKRDLATLALIDNATERKSVRAKLIAKAKRRAEKSEAFLAKRAARRAQSQQPIELALSPKSKLLVIKNSGTGYSFIMLDKPHAIQLHAQNKQLANLITQMPDVVPTAEEVDAEVDAEDVEDVDVE